MQSHTTFRQIVNSSFPINGLSFLLASSDVGKINNSINKEASIPIKILTLENPTSLQVSDFLPIVGRCNLESGFLSENRFYQGDFCDQFQPTRSLPSCRVCVCKTCPFSPSVLFSVCLFRYLPSPSPSLIDKILQNKDYIFFFFCFPFQSIQPEIRHQRSVYLAFRDEMMLGQKTRCQHMGLDTFFLTNKFTLRLFLWLQWGFMNPLKWYQNFSEIAVVCMCTFVETKSLAILNFSGVPDPQSLRNEPHPA